MKKTELDKLISDGKTFDDIISVISDFELDNDDIWHRESLLDFAIYQINEGTILSLMVTDILLVIVSATAGSSLKMELCLRIKTAILN